MRGSYKGLIIAGLQLVLVTSLGAKYLIDRARLPRVWVRTYSYDPNLPIRGRYASLQLEVQLPPGAALSDKSWVVPAELKIENNQLVAVPKEEGQQTGVTIERIQRGIVTVGPPLPAPPAVIVIHEPVAFFISEHAQDPSWRTWRRSDEELWAEVSIPRHGPPRPIRLGVKKNGVLSPLQLD